MRLLCSHSACTLAVLFAPWWLGSATAGVPDCREQQRCAQYPARHSCVICGHSRTLVYQHILTFTLVHWHVLWYTDVFFNILTSTLVYWHGLWRTDLYTTILCSGQFMTFALHGGSNWLNCNLFLSTGCGVLWSYPEPSVEQRSAAHWRTSADHAGRPGHWSLPSLHHLPLH